MPCPNAMLGTTFTILVTLKIHGVLPHLGNEGSPAKDLNFRDSCACH
jgi:hypothetical protein